ncbi:hypothetical protein [Sphingobacterium daejeonense]|uniref:hypothetical protein n=1 Tax=Sphingobacterium daejeonense TaxID=371142 RepID=UPI003D313CA7
MIFLFIKLFVSALVIMFVGSVPLLSIGRIGVALSRIRESKLFFVLGVVINFLTLSLVYLMYTVFIFKMAQPILMDKTLIYRLLIYFGLFIANYYPIYHISNVTFQEARKVSGEDNSFNYVNSTSLLLVANVSVFVIFIVLIFYPQLLGNFNFIPRL